MFVLSTIDHNDVGGFLGGGAPLMVIENRFVVKKRRRRKTPFFYTQPAKWDFFWGGGGVFSQHPSKSFTSSDLACGQRAKGNKKAGFVHIQIYFLIPLQSLILTSISQIFPCGDF